MACQELAHRKGFSPMQVLTISIILQQSSVSLVNFTYSETVVCICFLTLMSFPLGENVSIHRKWLHPIPLMINTLMTLKK